MARKKSAEELMLEAELATAKDSASLQAGESSAQAEVTQVDLPEVPATGLGNAATGSGVASRVASRVPAKLKQPKVLGAMALVVCVLVLGGFFLSRYLYSNSTDVWDGTADTSWYVEGTTTSFSIETAEQLAGIRELCNSGTTFEGVKFTLARNLDLYDIPTKPIGDNRQIDGRYNRFCGSLDGHGHYIWGINIEEDMYDHAGLFGNVDDGDFRNLTVDGKVSGQVRVGGLVGELDGGSIENVTNLCAVSSLKTATSYYPVQVDVGGVCGIWLGISHRDDVTAFSLANLTNEGEVSARGCNAGGVVGTIANGDDLTLNVRNLVNNASVTVYCESDERDEAVGGVVGTIGALGTLNVSGCQNNGDVACSTVLSVGGVFGGVYTPQSEGSGTKGIAITNCKNTAHVAANAADPRAHVAGIAGHVEDPDVTFEECENEGELAATNGNTDELYATNGAEVWDEWEDEHPKYFA